VIRFAEDDHETRGQVAVGEDPDPTFDPVSPQPLPPKRRWEDADPFRDGDDDALDDLAEKILTLSAQMVRGTQIEIT